MNKKIFLLGLTVVATLLGGCSSEKPSTSTKTSYVDQDVHVESVTIKNKATRDLKVGDTLSLEIEILPKTATNTLVHYSSSDESVAIVSFDNVLHARRKAHVRLL